MTWKQPRQTYRPPNYLSAPIPGAPIPSNLSVYRIRTGWVLTPQEQQILLMWAKADDHRQNRPVLAELDKTPLWPPRNYSIWWHKSWHKAWRRNRNQGIWPDPRYCTSYRWAKIALALYFHRLALSMANRRQWRHLPYDDRVAAAMLGLSEAIRRFDRNTYSNGLKAYASDWIRKELQRLAYNERRGLPEKHKPYGFGEGEFGLGIQMSFRPREYSLVGYNENAYRRQLPYVTVPGLSDHGGTCVVENVRQGAPAGEDDDVEHVGPSFTNWSPVTPEKALGHKEEAFEKYNYRSVNEIVGELRDDKEIKIARGEGRYRCDASIVISPDAVIAARATGAPGRNLATIRTFIEQTPACETARGWLRVLISNLGARRTI